MKKIIEFLQLLLLLLVFVLYPIISIRWYHVCRIRSDNDAVRFLRYTICGFIGILGMIGVWFIPAPWNGLVGLITFVPYFLGCKLLWVLIVKKRYGQAI